MEIIKDIATVIGLVLSAIILITLCCKLLRRKIGNVIRKASNMEETSQALEEVRAMMPLRYNKDKQKNPVFKRKRE